jgi:transcriptional regulator with XRE-family HTH domain
MTRKSKKDRPPTLIRGIVAQNIEQLRDQVYRDLRTPTARNTRLAKESGVATSQIQRIIAQELGTSIDYLEMLAKPLGVRPQDLLHPYLVSQPKPPDYRDESPGQDELQRRPSR